MKKLLKMALLLAAGRVMARRRGRAVPPEASEDVPRAGAAPSSQRRQRLRTVGGFVAVAAAGGLLVAASGLVPIKASSGHWGVTEWFLNWSKARSVSTHSMGVAALPDDSLAHPSLVLKGAGHYETGCRPCHGSPRLERPRIAREMTAEPPYLGPAIAEWENEELYYIVQHGVKFTGMPAWPAAEREDEVWAVVAFLRALPRLDAAAYRRLVWGAAEEAEGPAPLEGLLGPDSVPEAVTASCARCHGRDGLGRGTGAFPRLAGQRPDYLAAALRAYAEGARPSGLMEPLAAGLGPDEWVTLARYYARLPGPSADEKASSAEAATEATSESVARGRRIAHAGIPERFVPSCVDCHGPGGGPRNPFYPELAGQYAEYLALQLHLFKAGQRGGSAYAHLMEPVARRLEPGEMQDVARYYASLSGRSGASSAEGHEAGRASE